MNFKIEKILVEFSGIIISLFALVEVIKYAVGLVYLLFATGTLLPLIEQHKILHQFLELSCYIAIIAVAALAIISFIISLYGLKLYNIGAKLSKETAENLLVKILILMVVSLILGTFTIFVASSIAFLGTLIALARK